MWLVLLVATTVAATPAVFLRQSGERLDIVVPPDAGTNALYYPDVQRVVWCSSATRTIESAAGASKHCDSPGFLRLVVYESASVVSARDQRAAAKKRGEPAVRFGARVDSHSLWVSRSPLGPAAWSVDYPVYVQVDMMLRSLDGTQTVPVTQSIELRAQLPPNTVPPGPTPVAPAGQSRWRWLWFTASVMGGACAAVALAVLGLQLYRRRTAVAPITDYEFGGTGEWSARQAERRANRMLAGEMGLFNGPPESWTQDLDDENW